MVSCMDHGSLLIKENGQVESVSKSMTSRNQSVERSIASCSAHASEVRKELLDPLLESIGACSREIRPRGHSLDICDSE